MSLSLAIPAYNEEASLERMVQDYLQVIQGLDGDMPAWRVPSDASNERIS